MTTEYFERQIERFKAEGKLPGDFEIAEIGLMYGNRFVGKALGYAKGNRLKIGGEEIQLYDTYAWKFYFHGLECFEHEQLLKESDDCLSVGWNKESNRPEFVEVLHPWKERPHLFIREP